jgi:hypothetical protein
VERWRSPLVHGQRSRRRSSISHGRAAPCSPDGQSPCRASDLEFGYRLPASGFGRPVALPPAFAELRLRLRAGTGVPGERVEQDGCGGSYPTVRADGRGQGPGEPGVIDADGAQAR